MGEIYDETMSEVEEESGLTRGGERFRQEKRKRIGEGLVAIETQDHEGIPHGTKRPYSDNEENQDTLDLEEISTPGSNIPTPTCTTPHSGINTSLTLTCPVPTTLY